MFRCGPCIKVEPKFEGTSILYNGQHPLRVAFVIWDGAAYRTRFFVQKPTRCCLSDDRSHDMSYLVEDGLLVPIDQVTRGQK